MKIIFMGTPEFAVPCLDILIEKFDVQAVFTQPDRPKGRGKKLTISPIKKKALESDILVYQPEKIKKSENIEILKKINPDVIVVVAYGQLLSKEILDIPKYGCINVHASLLPKYRGAAPINFAIVNGETKSGVTTMYMAKGLDTGDIIDYDIVDITSEMTAGELHDILSEKGKSLIVKTLNSIENGDFHRTPQINSLSSYASMMDKDMAVIDWNKTAFEINCLIRGFNPWPIATSKLNDKKMKIFSSIITDIPSVGVSGKIVKITKEGIYVNCSDNQLIINEIQMPNKKRMLVKQYMLGNKIEQNIVLGV